MTKYEDVRDGFHTGDIVLFTGQSFVGGVIKFATNSRYSHVGMVCRIPDVGVFCFESHAKPQGRDHQTGTVRAGVQLVPLSERIRDYRGDVYLRRMKGQLSSQQLESLHTFRWEYSRAEYEKDLFELIGSAFDGIFPDNEEDLSSLFCSELVAEALQRMGVLTEDKPSNEYTPGDFSKEAGDTLDLTEGYAYENDEHIVFKQKRA